MGYTTYFNGAITVDPPLNAEEIAFLTKFNRSRRMDRELGPYYVDGKGDFGQGQDPDIRNHNLPPEGQPSLWCQWVPSEDGTEIVWDDGEKFSCAAEWMEYIIQHFLKPDPIAKAQLPFLQGHTCNGEITAEGEDGDDRWKLIVTNNAVAVSQGVVVYGGALPL